jgi:RNA polymerase sigma-70 factor (ECF subfamily)
VSRSRVLDPRRSRQAAIAGRINATKRRPVAYTRGDANPALRMTPEAFDAFYATTVRRLVFQVSLLTCDLGEAQDVVQEAFLRAWRQRERLDRDRAPEAWVRTTAMRLAVSRWRRAKRVVSGLPANFEQESLPGPSPDRVAVAAALRRLPEAQRITLVLFYLCDLDVQQVARETGVAIGTVKARLSRGRSALAKHLTDLPSEENVHA